jgi:rhodanese-related sulfurtransferase
MRKTYLLLLITTLFTGCLDGYIGSEGEPLLDYIEPEELKGLIDSSSGDIWIIDVTPTSHYRRNHIPSAKSFPSNEILIRLDEIPKDKYLIIYCETGARSQNVLLELEERGYTKTMNWGSYTRWPWEYEKMDE